ncbi:unnamed protein product [Tuber melanosporum]|uniref:(Perigord truffle) hypothetical protein n=1 Tax=Tuber melanosporum (strain Mel28) TaxID=656061 RepID=D5G8A8_TUBMM|nr:uncharacterized protein GSTUM_00002955001 [Tuber melanosporum]CAZ80751.1 unnamed protein product [Tuber melanosporum]
MASELFTCTSLVSSYYENPPSRISYSYCAKLMPTGPLTVMADSNILSNVEKSLVESVVETSTTDADANTKSTPIAAPSGTLINDNVLAHQNDNKPSIGTSSVGGISSGTVGADSDAIGHMNGTSPTDSGLKVDTESIGAPGSRPGSVSPTKTDGSRPLDRKSSLKKPTFKPVSLNKAFLKEQTSTSGPAPNPLSSVLSNTKGNLAFSHQPAPRGHTVSKLKLVKTGGTSQSSRPGLGSSLSTGIKRNEQAQPVWNKNQPIPPPPAKDVTDEELKKEYGIHMASRLGPEGTGAKWADIDDDDDDWVPEVPEKWGDALKLAPVEPTPPTIAPSPTPPAKVEQAPLDVADTSPPKTPLPATAKEEVRPKTLITERLSSKPVEKAPPPIVRASPWAKVPPAPVQSLASNVSQSRDMEPPRRSNYGTESIANHSSGQPHGMKEVSADVYGRSWRDGNHNQGPRERELYNSETGQLEPVQESRNKGPRARAEGNVDKPSVLQRPTGPPPPAEPSPAFQQQRSSMMHHRPDEYRRRRTSSNVSGGSGSTGRRPSFSKFGLEQPPTPEDGRFPLRPSPISHFSTDAHQDHNQTSLPAKFENSNQASNIEVPSLAAVPIKPAIPETPMEDLVAQQERIMKEGRELARKRRQEEEEKEEAAKKERLQVKLDELEKKALEKKEAELRAAEEARLAEEKAEADRKAEEERVNAEKKAAEEEAARKAAEARPVSDRYEHPRSYLPTQPQSRRSLNTMQNRSPNRSFAIPAIRDSKDQPWKHVSPGNDRYTSWGGAQQNSQGSGPNPWGPIEKPKFQGMNGVGNGTFDNGYSGFSTRPPPPTSAYPQNPRDDRRNSRGPPTSPGLSRGGLSQYDRAQAVSRWNALPGKILEDEAEQRRKDREAYLARQAEEAATGVKKPGIVPPKLVETWRKTNGDEPESKFVVKTETSQEGEQSSSAEKLPGGLLATTIGTSMEDTRVESSHPTGPAPNVPTGPAATRPASRFFPAAAGNLIAQHLGTQSKSSHSPAKALSPPGSPPPPMSAEHPVHGDINSRVVQLPPSGHGHYQHPHGRVSPTLHMNGYHRTNHPKSPQFSGVQAFEAVQQKILGMTQKHSPPQQTANLQAQPPKGPASRDFSTTKPLYDGSPERVVSRPATVSLPPQSDGEEGSSNCHDVYEESILTKPDNEEFFHELFERDFGSTPTVKLPHIVPAIYANHSKKIPAANLPKPYSKRPPSKWQLQTTDIFNPFGQKDFINGEGKRFIPVHLPGGASIEVLSRDGRRSTGNKKGYSQQRSKNSRYNGGGNTGGGHIGRGGVGRRVADPVQ